MSWTGRSEAALQAALPVPNEIRQLQTAKPLRLRFDEASGTLKLTCPSRMSRRTALAWALDQREWIDAQVARALPAERFAAGALIPVEGEEVRIAWDPQATRTPKLIDGELRVGGPAEGLARRIETFLKRRALETMSPEVATYAAAAGVTAASVSVGDAGSRWGSCS